MLPRAVLAPPGTAERTGMTDEAGLGGEELSPTNAAILEMIREGRYDAEIASRLYISTADVKARIERMLAQGGLRERSDFLRPPVPELDGCEVETPPFERRPRTISLHNAVLSALGALAIGVGVGWVLRDEQAGKAKPAEEEAPYVSVLSSADFAWFLQSREALTILASDEPSRVVAVGETKTVDLGPLFAIAGVQQTIDTLAYDADHHRLVTLTGTAVTGENFGWAVERRTSGELTLIRQEGGRVIVLRMDAVNDLTKFTRDGDVVTISTSDGTPPRIELWVDGPQWSLGLDGRLVVYL